MMNFSWDNYERYVEHIVKDENVSLPSPIKINSQSNNIGFQYKRKRNSIVCSNACITNILLCSAYRFSPRKTRKLLFLYYLAHKNLINHRLNSSMYLFYKICKVLDRKWKKVFGIAKNVYLNEITAFLIGHETAHACFKADAKYKDTVTKKIKEFLVDTNAPKNLRERYALSLIPESITEKEIEEFACDYIGLKHLFKSYASLHDYSSEQIKELIGQLLCIVTMQMYPSNIDTLYSFKLSKKGLSLHAHKHVASVYRLGLAAYFIQDTLIDEYDFDYSSFLDDQIKLSKTLLDGIWTVDVSSLLTIMNMVKMNEPPELEDIDRVIEHFKIFSDISEAIRGLLLGEEHKD